MPDMAYFLLIKPFAINHFNCTALKKQLRLKIPTKSIIFLNH